MYRSEEGESFFTLTLFSCQNKRFRCFWNIFGPPSTLLFVSVAVAFHCISANHFSNHAAVFLISAWIFPTLQAATSVHLLEPSVKINFYKDLKHAWVCIITEDFVSAGILHGCIDAINMQISRWCIQMKRWSSFLKKCKLLLLANTTVSQSVHRSLGRQTDSVNKR